MELSRLLFHVVTIFTTVFLVGVVLLNWTGKVKFGLGLGDIVYLIIIVAIIVGVAIFYFRSLRLYDENIVSSHDIYLILVCAFIVVFICLKLTVLRGPAAPWDGTIFF